MFDQITEQLQKTMQPITEITNINVKALETLAASQSELFKTLLDSGSAFAQSSGSPTGAEGAVESQKAYAQNLQETIIAAAKDAYSVISTAQEQSGAILQNIVTEVQAQATAATKQA